MKYELIPKLLVLKGRVGRKEGKPNPLIGYCFVTNNQYDQSRTSEGSMSVNEIDILNGFFFFWWLMVLWEFAHLSKGYGA